MYRIVEALADQLLGYSVLYSSVWFAVAVNMAFFTSIVVLDTASTWAIELNLYISANSFKFTCFRVCLFYIIALAFNFGDKLDKVIKVILKIYVSPDERSLCKCTIPVDSGLDEDVLEDTLRSDIHYGYLL